jgi:phosphate transport system substrate-binding protein
MLPPSFRPVVLDPWGRRQSKYKALVIELKHWGETLGVPPLGSSKITRGMFKMKSSNLVGLAAIPVLLAGSAVAQVSINAAGASFPATIYQQWGQEFTGAKINYQSVGSGAGIKQLTEGTVDFGASDMPMTDAQIAKMKVKPLHFPTVLGGVVPIYNIPGVSAELKFTPETLAGIYLGEIKKWSDPKIAADNKGVKFPDAEITTVHRADGSGTTFVWCDYLAKVSPAWTAKIGGACSTALQWPASGLAGPQNDGVAGLVKQTPNTIGYVELVYASKQHIAYGAVKNKAGTFVKATVASVTAAAASSTKEIPDDFRVSITNAVGADAYPISSFTYLLVPGKIDDAAKKKAIKDFLTWMLSTGQKDAPGLDFAPLPKAVAAKEQKQIALIQ